MVTIMGNFQVDLGSTNQTIFRLFVLCVYKTNAWFVFVNMSDWWVTCLLYVLRCLLHSVCVVFSVWHDCYYVTNVRPKECERLGWASCYRDEIYICYMYFLVIGIVKVVMGWKYVFPYVIVQEWIVVRYTCIMLMF